MSTIEERVAAVEATVRKLEACVIDGTLPLNPATGLRPSDFAKPIADKLKAFDLGMAGEDVVVGPGLSSMFGVQPGDPVPTIPKCDPHAWAMHGGGRVKCLECNMDKGAEFAYIDREIEDHVNAIAVLHAERARLQ